MRKQEIRRFRQLARAYGRVLGAIDSGALCCVGLTVGQAYTLLEIEERGRANVIELADVLGVSKGTASKTVDRLVEEGLVERVTRESDRRFHDLTLTDSGKARARAVHELGDDVVGRTFEKIPAERHQDVIECFEILVEASMEADSETSAVESECVGNATQHRGGQEG